MRRALHGRGLGASAVLLLAALALPACSGGHAPGDVRDPHADEHGERDDHDADTIELAPERLAAAGVRFEAAGPGAIERAMTLPAVVATDADTITHVNPTAPGIVRSIEKRLGETVARGDLLCVIDSVELGRAVAEHVRAAAMVAAAATTLEHERELFARRLESAERVLSGAVESYGRIHERERELQERAVSTVRPLLEAERALRAAELERERALTDLRAERDARLLALEVELDERRILAGAARGALLAMGVGAARLEDLGPDSPLAQGTYELRAQRAGIVAGRHITTGEFVDAQTKLYTLEDLSRVWVLASAYEQQIRAVRTGQKARVLLDAFPGEALSGAVTFIGYEVDPESRALRVRLELENPRLEAWPEPYPLRPGMFGSVELVVERLEAPVVLPELAIVHEDDGDFVFVRVGEGLLERRAVRLGPPSGATVEVLAGVAAGELVAVTGTFQLKSVLRQGELGGGHDH